MSRNNRIYVVRRTFWRVTSTLVTIGTGLVVAAPVFASKFLTDDYDFGLGHDSPEDIAVSLVAIILDFLGLVAVVLVLYGGIKWMTAAGNDEKIKSAKGLLTAGAIGLLIVLASYGISIYVFDVLEKATGL